MVELGPWQPSLFAAAPAADELSFTAGVRHRLDESAWIDHVPGWLAAPAELFDELVDTAPWHTDDIVIHGRRVTQPRLLAGWPCGPDDPEPPAGLGRLRVALAAHYRRAFDSIGANLYRDGRDSVAWHRERIPREVHEPVVAIVTLGSPRRFLLRPRGGRTALTLVPQAGDLVVMGGSSQRTWEHTIPKVAAAGPRISVTFRHSTDG